MDISQKLALVTKGEGTYLATLRANRDVDNAKQALEDAKAALEAARAKSQAANAAHDEVANEADGLGISRRAFKATVEDRVRPLLETGIITLDDAADAAEMPAEQPVVRRTRRTKAEIQAARAAEAGGEEAEVSQAGDTAEQGGEAAIQDAPEGASTVAADEGVTMVESVAQVAEALAGELLEDAAQEEAEAADAVVASAEPESVAEAPVVAATVAEEPSAGVEAEEAVVPAKPLSPPAMPTMPQMSPFLRRMQNTTGNQA